MARGNPLPEQDPALIRASGGLRLPLRVGRHGPRVLPLLPQIGQVGALAPRQVQPPPAAGTTGVQEQPHRLLDRPRLLARLLGRSPRCGARTVAGTRTIRRTSAGNEHIRSDLVLSEVQT